MSIRQANTACVGSFVDELARCGLRHVVISPGSRSTPLTMVFQKHPRIRVWMHVDERSAGFFALGIAKAKREPVALVCTSGTAAANYFPAVTEAKLSRVPLIVLTADRPHELRDVGAPQTMDQLHLFGTHVKWFVDMPLPETAPSLVRHIRTTAARAMATAVRGPAGPVHLNLPFREPLVPDMEDPSLFTKGRRSGESSSYVQVHQSYQDILEPQSINRLNGLDKVERGLIICGPQTDPNITEPLLRLARFLQYPILADPLSGLRSGPHDKTWVLDSYDAFLRDEEMTKKLEPEVVIRFGAMPVSKALLLFLQRYPSSQHIVVDGGGGWQDPTLLATDMVYADPASFCQALIGDRSDDGERTSWSLQWQEINSRSRRIMEEQGRTPNLSEGRIFLELAEWLPEKSLLFVGNSMPVRDMDSFFLNNSRGIQTMANRGANGIDGVVSSALGAATMVSHMTLVIGDLSFYHDLNGLLAAKLHSLNATIIVVNNNGGGIFSFLPQAKEAEAFEDLFGTPIDLDFSHVVRMYGGTFRRVTDWADFRKAHEEGRKEGGLSVIEIVTDRGKNAALHREIWQAVAKGLKEEA